MNLNWEKVFEVCKNDCSYCPGYEKCFENDNEYWEDDDRYDDGDSRAMELQENQDFAQDDGFEQWDMDSYVDDYGDFN
jgi:hypothetical protein